MYDRAQEEVKGGMKVGGGGLGTQQLCLFLAGNMKGRRAVTGCKVSPNESGPLENQNSIKIHGQPEQGELLLCC